MAQNQSMKTSMVIFSVLMIQLCCTVFDVSANSSGAPNWTCKTMKPGHGHQPSMPSPFTIDVNPLVITPGSAITVTLKSDGVRFFKGFLVTAFRSTGSGSRLDNLIGKFQGPPGTRETCHGKGYTHRNSQPKSNIVLTWTPPASMSNSDKLVFRVTFVEDHSKYWKDLSSVELTVSSFPDTAPASQSASASKPQPASDNAGAASVSMQPSQLNTVEQKQPDVPNTANNTDTNIPHISLIDISNENPVPPLIPKIDLAVPIQPDIKPIQPNPQQVQPNISQIGGVQPETVAVDSMDPVQSNTASPAKAAQVLSLPVDNVNPTDTQTVIGGIINPIPQPIPISIRGPGMWGWTRRGPSIWRLSRIWHGDK